MMTTKKKPRPAALDYSTSPIGVYCPISPMGTAFPKIVYRIVCDLIPGSNSEFEEGNLHVPPGATITVEYGRFHISTDPSGDI